jgi:hypothetical protein
MLTVQSTASFLLLLFLTLFPFSKTSSISPWKKPLTEVIKKWGPESLGTQNDDPSFVHLVHVALALSRTCIASSVVTLISFLLGVFILEVLILMDLADGESYNIIVVVIVGV